MICVDCVYESALLKPQGNIQVSAFGTPFTVSTIYLTGASSAVGLVDWSTIDVIFGDQSTLAIPASSSQFSIPASPTVSISGSGATYLFAVALCYSINGGTYIGSVSGVTIKTGASSSPSAMITAPANPGDGAVGWVPLYGDDVLGLASTYISGTQITNYIAFGTNATVNPDVTSVCQIYNGSTNISGWSTSGGGAGFWFFGLPASSDYVLYPCWDVSDATVVLAGALLSTKSSTYSCIQSGDGYVALSNGSIDLNTPASGGSSSGSAGESGGGRGAL